jgi:hypothetical protein
MQQRPGQTFPKIQLLTVADLMAGKRPKMPTAVLPYLKAKLATRISSPSIQTDTTPSIRAIGAGARSVDLWGAGGIDAKAGLGRRALVAFRDGVVDACRVADCGLVCGRDHTVG